MVFAALLTGIACIIFALANTLMLAIIARMLMGFCGAFAFVGSLRLAIIFFKPKIFAMLTGITQAMGMLGAAVGEAPMKIYIEHVGVSFAMLSFASLFFGIALLMLYLSKHTQDLDVRNKPTISNISYGLRQLMGNKSLWINCIFIGCLYGPTTIFAEIWGPHLQLAFAGYHRRMPLLQQA